MKLLIGNKNYSTWSMRPWVLMRHFEIPFSEELLPLNGDGWKQRLIERTPAGQVPVLEHDGLAISETLAIVEYLQELFPDKAIWPADAHDRARARAMASEMATSFTALRGAAPMNIRSRHPGRVAVAPIRGDLDRLDALLGAALQHSGGPYLFGDFSAVDAMFAPVAMRVITYDLPVSQPVQGWIDAIKENEAVAAWRAEALLETAIVPQDEIDMMHAGAGS